MNKSIKFYNTIEECNKNRIKVVNPKYNHIRAFYDIACDYKQLSYYILSIRNYILKYKFDKNIELNEPEENKILQQSIDTILKLDFYRDISNVSVNNTLHYMFDKMFMGIYVKIVDNSVLIYQPFANMHYKNNWKDKIKFKVDNNNITDDIYKYIKYNKSNKNRERGDWSYINKNVDEWTTNNCLIGTTVNPQIKMSNVGDNQRFILLHYLLKETCKKYTISNCEFIINRRDNPVMKKNLTEPYHDIYDDYNKELTSHKYNKYCPILSTSSSDDFADIAIPNEDDILISDNKYFINACKNNYKDVLLQKNPIWEDKKNIALFRGSATGCGITIDTNQRLKLAHLSYTLNKSYLDAKIVGWNKRPKKFMNKPLETIDPNDFNFKEGNKMTRDEQLQYKYHIYADGHVAAYRLTWLLSTGSVILMIKSKYKYRLWYFDLLEEGVHYISVKEDLEDLDEKINWCLNNDNTAKQIGINAKDLFDKYLTKEGQINYMAIVLNKIASNTNYEKLNRPIDYWNNNLDIELMFIPKKFNYKNKKMAILVPFRNNKVENRQLHYKAFIKHMIKLLDYMKIISDQHILVVIIEQSNDDKKFNRGKLLNIGYKYIKKKGYDYIITHDIDMYPNNNAFKYYRVYPKNPIHIADRVDKKKYNYEYFMGGILSISNTDFENCNGYPNNFWGWGGEDDELYKRMKRNNLIVHRPHDGVIYTLEHTYSKSSGMEKEEKKKLKYEHKTTWNSNGLNNLTYKLLNTNKIHDYIHQITVQL
jgi:hypothetical protein